MYGIRGKVIAAATINEHQGQRLGPHDQATGRSVNENEGQADGEEEVATIYANTPPSMMGH